jgi:hypothetical protein
MPVAFSVGRFLIEGPVRPLFVWLSDAPVLALLGFQYYALSGGIPIAIILGVLTGTSIVRLLRGLRLRLSAFEESTKGSERRLPHWVVRVLTWVFGHDWRDPKPAKWSRVVLRPLAAVLVLGGLTWAILSSPGPWLRPLVACELEDLNGATVDLEAVEVDAARGQVTLVGLAMADETDLDRNLFAASRLEADVSTADLLRGRVAIDRAVARDARRGTRRDERGELTRRPPAPEPTEGPEAGAAKTLDDYLADVRVWKERLAQVREWLERLSGGEEGQAEEPTEESVRERLEREVRERGWGRVAARGLRRDAPALLVSELSVEGMTGEKPESDPIDLEARNLSSDPRLVAEAPSVSIRSRSGRIRFDVGLGGASAAGGENGIDFAWNGVATDRLLGQLRIGERPPVSGGTVDLGLAGEWTGGEVGRIELPLLVTVRDASWSVGGGDPVTLEAVTLPFGLRGKIDDPRIEFDSEELRSAILDAGGAELRDRLGSQAESKLDELLQKGEDALDEELDPALKDGAKKKAKGLLKGLLGDD